MDGFHWSRKKLGTFPDPEEAIRRRGAPGTFDAQDPRPDTLAITSRHRIVIFEGLYLQLASVPIWQDIPPLMDEAWWIECPLAICRTRIIQRHVDSGISPDHDAATVQTDGNDLCNAQFILDHRIPTVDRVIEQLTVGADGSLVASLN
ncbi:hypothetical protein H4R35_000085 [Dimargaris xerosporica]|nr:hypothetical protein H4R35_000085 [Dimargaris xerosporica]